MTATTPTHRDGPMAFVDSVDSPVLDDDDRHHFQRVLRVREGSPMVVCDGAGSWRRATFGESISVVGDVEVIDPPTPTITVAFALMKGDRPEFVVQKLTELGVDTIVPMTTEHCVVRWDERKAHRQRERFARISREAAMQCRRTHLPRVGPVTAFAELIVGSSAPGAGRLLLADPDGGSVAQMISEGTAGEPLTVLVGPEGGWSDAEKNAGLRQLRIADHILRAETASLAAAVLLTAHRSQHS